MNFRAWRVLIAEKLQELVARSTEEMVDHAGHRRIPNIGEFYGRFVIMGFGFESPLEESLQVQTVHDRHDGGVSERAGLVDGDLDILHRNGMTPPDSLHDVELKR